MSPGLGLAVLFVLIGAQVSRIVMPARGPYIVALLLSAGGVVAGELVAIITGAGGPRLGALHPIAEAVGVAVCEVTGAVLAPSRRRRP